ncbi:MAG: 4Fe-4S ferredoxin [Candidatus Melainabacteria bacterium RIFOXYA12_FULL_32_12]|nr:MAG: 4Fe-4S ferredoxin [Candidatus Melainabacteria bacterium RIFOXYA2_FULL_32_9]OGI24188.1 MAG: 4Fe-4S ferredoxin [Candidatus Melainabacteria bacterium RIFOXYA12_FULL_32_12]
MSDIKKMIPEHIDDKLFTVKYKSAESSHLAPNQEDCAKCQDKACTFVCPANVYSWDEEQKKILVGFENCLECGACRIACSYQSLSWNYPTAGCGVTFKHS